MGYMFQREPQTCQKLGDTVHVMHDVTCLLTNGAYSWTCSPQSLPMRDCCMLFYFTSIQDFTAWIFRSGPPRSLH